MSVDDPTVRPTTAGIGKVSPMLSRRRLWLIACLSATAAGCAQSSGSLLSRGTNVGTLKTSLSHMEYENQQLRKEVASLKAEARQTEDRLVQEESANGELSARLDDARALLKRKGLDGGEMADSSVPDPGPERPRTTLPAGRSTRKPRKPPFAQVPGRVDPLPPAEGGDEAGPQSRLEDPAVWLPVARGTTEASGSRR